jgi:hypothetical protein
MPTELQNFDLYDTATSTAADVHGDLDTTPVIIRRVVQAAWLDLSMDSHADRELLIQRLTIALANQRRE